MKYEYFRFWQPYRYFQLSVALGHVLCALHDRNPQSQVCRWNFKAYRARPSFSDISIPGFVGYFRLPLVDEMACEQFLLSLCGRNQGLPLENSARIKMSGGFFAPIATNVGTCYRI